MRKTLQKMQDVSVGLKDISLAHVYIEKQWEIAQWNGETHSV